MRFLRLADVRSRVGLSRSQIYRLATGDFPKAYGLGARAVAWLESDIDAWIRARVRQSRGTGGQTTIDDQRDELSAKEARVALTPQSTIDELIKTGSIPAKVR